jgi:hypothetical protein
MLFVTAGGRTGRPSDKVEAEIAAICKPRRVAGISTATLTGDIPVALRRPLSTFPGERSPWAAIAATSVASSLRLTPPRVRPMRRR